MDEGGKRVPEQVERLKRLFLICRQDPRMVEYIVDYVDADTRGDFEEGARNKRLLMPEELMRIRGLPRGILFGDPRERSRGILEFVTLWPVSGGKKINLNTAPAEVLASLDDEWGLELAQQVVSWRSGKKENGRPADFEKVSELEETLGMDEELFDRVSPFLTVKSGCFEIHTRSTSGTTEKAHLFVVTRGEEELELEASMARHDLFWVKPPEEEY